MPEGRKPEDDKMSWNGYGGISSKSADGHSRRGVEKRKGVSRVFLLVAAVVAVLVAGVALVVSLRSPEEKNSVQSPRREKPKENARTRPSSPPAATEETKSESANTNALPPDAKFYGRSSNVPTSNTNNIHYASQSGLKIVDADGNEHTVRSTPIFKSRVDNMLWAAVRPGGMPSGLNALRSRMRHQTGSDAAFLQALRTQDIEIEADDPPHVVAAKEMTIQIKDSIIKEMDGGRSFDEIYAEVQETTRKERMYERIAQEDYRKMVQARDAEAIRKYVRDMNPVMEEMGLKKLRVPSWAEEDQ